MKEASREIEGGRGGGTDGVREGGRHARKHSVNYNEEMTIIMIIVGVYGQLLVVLHYNYLEHVKRSNSGCPCTVLVSVYLHCDHCANRVHRLNYNCV